MADLMRTEEKLSQAPPDIRGRADFKDTGTSAEYMQGVVFFMGNVIRCSPLLTLCHRGQCFVKSRPPGCCHRRRRFTGFSARGFQGEMVLVPYPGPTGLREQGRSFQKFTPGCICGWRRNEREDLGTRKRGSMIRCIPCSCLWRRPWLCFSFACGYDRFPVLFALVCLMLCIKFFIYNIL